ncbi:MAG: ABC transporter ATP-binding protein [Bacteroidales bacterium]|nr:ABC transporter ATP-binding protein [Bacteroidales bacterium]
MHSSDKYCDKLFEIDDLKCRYSGNKTVLHVSNLIIERGRITAILGLSGIGKSTMLETLGLMNNTLPRESKVKFYPRTGGNPIDYAWLWYEANEKIRSSIRKEHFSFIFQESNLMYNFSALDNICITLLLQNKTKKNAKSIVKKYVHDMEMDQKISDSTMIFNLSGGERQRLSFIRAVAPDFTVLFGDEPTGNLDVINADRVLKNLSHVLKSKGKSAIIVTHDIKLSIENADDIILIEEKDDEIDGKYFSYGYITGNNVYKSSLINERKMWKNHTLTDWYDSEWMKDEILRIFQQKKIFKNS